MLILQYIIIYFDLHLDLGLSNMCIFSFRSPVISPFVSFLISRKRAGTPSCWTRTSRTGRSETTSSTPTTASRASSRRVSQANHRVSSPLGLQSSLEDEVPMIRLVCPRNGTTVLPNRAKCCFQRRNDGKFDKVLRQRSIRRSSARYLVPSILHCHVRKFKGTFGIRFIITQYVLVFSGKVVVFHLATETPVKPERLRVVVSAKTCLALSRIDLFHAPLPPPLFVCGLIVVFFFFFV